MLVHGLLGSMDTSWGRIPELLKKLPDVDVLLVAFPTDVLRRAPTFDRLGAHLSSDIRLLCDGYERIVLVGHSLGCLVIQSAIVQELFHGRADAEVVGRITDVVLYAPPFEGKQWLTVLDKFDVPASRQLKSMAAGGDALLRLRAEWVNRVYRPLIEQGQQASKRHIPATIVIGLQDDIVTRDEAVSVYSDPPPLEVPGDHLTLKLPDDERDLRFIALGKVVFPDFTRAPSAEERCPESTPQAVDFKEAAIRAVGQWLIGRYHGGSTMLPADHLGVDIVKRTSSGQRFDVVILPLPPNFRTVFDVAGQMATAPRNIEADLTWYVTVAHDLEEATVAKDLLQHRLESFPRTKAVIGFLDSPDHFTAIWESGEDVGDQGVDQVDSADRRIQAHVAFREAQKSLDWKIAESLVAEALGHDPTIRGPRSWIGLRLTEVVAGWFKDVHGCRDLTSEIPAVAPQYLVHGGPPTDRASEWLTNALDQNENQQGHVSAALALLDGMQRRYESMVRRIEEALGVSGAAKDYLMACNHLIMLVHSCSSMAEIRQLGELLDSPLPADIEVVRVSVEGVDWKSTHYAFVDWFVIEKTETGVEDHQAKVPGLLRLFRGPDDGDQMTGQWRYMVNSQLLAQSPETGYTRFTDLIAELDRRFVFICAEPAVDAVRVRPF